MKKELLIYMVLLLFLASFSLSQPIDEQFRQQKNFTELEKAINNQTRNIPNFIRVLAGKQKVNFHLNLSNGTENITIAVKSKNMIIKNIRTKSYSKPSFELWISEKDLEKISKSEKPFSTAIKLIKNDEIRIKVNGSFNKLQFFLVKKLLGG